MCGNNSLFGAAGEQQRGASSLSQFLQRVTRLGFRLSFFSLSSYDFHCGIWNSCQSCLSTASLACSGDD